MIQHTLEYKYGTEFLRTRKDIVFCDANPYRIYTNNNGGGGAATILQLARALYKLKRAEGRQSKWNEFHTNITAFFPYIRHDHTHTTADSLIQDRGIKIATTFYLGQVIKKHRYQLNQSFMQCIKAANTAIDNILITQNLRDTIIQATGSNCITLDFVDKETIAYIQKHIDSILAWVKTTGFNKYNSLPYPPLLNPDTFDYNNTPAKIAYALNMPMPSNYEFILLAANVGGHTAMVRTLKMCDINTSDDHYGPKTLYEANYDICVHKGYNAIITTCYSKYDYKMLYDKFFYLLHKKVPIINLVRDPIGRLRRILNIPHENYFESFPINLMEYNKHKLDNRIAYRFNKNLPLRESIGEAISIFFFNRRDMKSYGFNDITHMGMADILPDKVFSTLQFLSEKLHFHIPLSREHYEKLYSTEYGKNVLPLALVYKNIRMFIVAKYTFADNKNSLINMSIKDLTQYIDISSYFNINMPVFKQELIIIAHKDYLHDIEKIDPNDNIDSVLNELFNDIYARIDVNENRYMMTEARLLHELRQDIVAYNIVKEACQKELALIPREIIDSFAYYKLFLDMQIDKEI